MSLNPESVIKQPAPSHPLLSSAFSPKGLRLELEIEDPEVVAELSRLPAGRERERFAAEALRLGVLALRLASGNLDVSAIRAAGRRQCELC